MDALEGGQIHSLRLSSLDAIYRLCISGYPRFTFISQASFQ